MKVHHEVTFCFCGFQNKGLEKKLKVFYEKKLFFFNTHFISMNNNNEYPVLDVMTLVKMYYLYFESIVYCFRLLACLIRKDLYKYIT